MSEQGINQEELRTAETAGASEKKKKHKKEKVRKSVGREILEWVLTIVVAVVAALIIRSFVFELVKVDGGSMEDTLDNGEIMFVSKFDYSSTWLTLPFQSNNAAEQASRITFGSPKRLDVVICHYPARGAVNFVKRVVGLPGETVALSQDGYLLINGKQVPEEAEIEGITEAYRKGYGAYPAYYIPQKGDTVVIRQNTATRDGISLTINDQKWTRRQTSLVMKADGKTLKIFSRNVDDSSRETDGSKISTETVVSYDGKILSVAEFIAQYPDLIGRELTVDEDYYFVMGDHRDNSNDSRSVGALERSAIIGHARSVVFPFNKWRGVE